MIRHNYKCDACVLFNSQSVYNRLLLVWIVSGACFQHPQLAAILNASLSVFEMTLETLRINRKEREGDFCDDVPKYA